MAVSFGAPPVIAASLFPAAAGFAAALLASLAIVATRRWHGAVSFDVRTGPQKFHMAPTPRIGGLAVYAGLWIAALASTSPERAIPLAVAAAATPGMIAGLFEDVTKRAGVGFRFVATLLSGLAFCVLSGHVVTSVELPLLNGLLALPVIAFAATALAVAGFSHAMNVIDGFNGLAAGTGVLMMAAFASAAFAAGDPALGAFCLAVIGVLFGFLALNFPGGRLFLGDGGAYTLGLAIAAAAVMLPERNPQVSPWVSVVILAYPLLEVAVASARKMLRGRSPCKPDRLHLHMLIYRRYGKRLAHALDAGNLANPIAGSLMWAGAGASLVLLELLPRNREGCLVALACIAALYALAYRRALRRPVPGRRSPAVPEHARP